jgi:hypothetical protein
MTIYWSLSKSKRRLDQLKQSAYFRFAPFDAAQGAVLDCSVTVSKRGLEGSLK